MPDFVKEGLASADELDEQYRKTLGMIPSICRRSNRGLPAPGCGA